MSNKVRDELIDSLDPHTRDVCKRYFAALEKEKLAAIDVRAAQDIKRTAYDEVYRFQKQINGNDKTHAVGTILVNVRNGRFYEVAAKGQYGDTLVHLNAKTAAKSERYSYGWGPKLALPESHPFVRKRINRRLAERLEGKE